MQNRFLDNYVSDLCEQSVSPLKPGKMEEDSSFTSMETNCSENSFGSPTTLRAGMMPSRSEFDATETQRFLFNSQIFGEAELREEKSQSLGSKRRSGSQKFRFASLFPQKLSMKEEKPILKRSSVPSNSNQESKFGNNSVSQDFSSFKNLDNYSSQAPFEAGGVKDRENYISSNPFLGVSVEKTDPKESSSYFRYLPVDGFIFDTPEGSASYDMEESSVEDRTGYRMERMEDSVDSNTRDLNSSDKLGTFFAREEEKSKNLVNWNRQFQQILDLPNGEHKSMKLSSIIKDFHFNARKYGEVIISEKCLPLDKKTIKPVQLGGIAGGEKYVVHGQNSLF